jgi:virulence factor Mce-like protein
VSSPFDVVRRRFDIFPAKHRSRPLLIGSVVIALIALALVSAGLRHVPLVPKSGNVVRAEFTAADQVSNRTVVRVRGVEVGRVEGVAPGSDPYRTTLVNMRIDNGNIHLRADASAAVRWRTLLGGLMYIDLNPGSPSAPPLGDNPIPASRTSSQVEFDQLLEAYAGPTAQQQRNLFKGLRNTFADPQGIGHTIHTLAPTLTTIDQGLQPLLGAQSGDLRNLIAATARTVSGLDNTSGLDGLVSGADTTLAVTDAQRNNLGQFLELSPPSLNSTFTTMRRLRTTLDHLDPLVTNLQPGARDIAPAARAAEPALGQTDAVLRAATPLLMAAGPTFDALKGASDTGVPLMYAFDPTLTRLLDQILPYLRRQDPGTKLLNYEMYGPFWSDLSSAAAEYDSVGYRIRFTVPPNLNSFISQPFATSAKYACDQSALPNAASRCPQVAQALTKGWFQAPASAAAVAGAKGAAK